MERKLGYFLSVFLSAFLAPGADLLAATLVLEAAEDVTLYESATGSFASGAGIHLFAGTTAEGLIRRSAFRFELPMEALEGATIQSVQVHLACSRQNGPPTTMSLHRVNSSWTEGASDPPGEEGGGAPPVPGDTTWIHSSYPSAFWLQPGGDFAPIPSASVVVGTVGPVTFNSTFELVIDVASWVGDPTMNFGWILRGEEGAIATAKRFESHEYSVPLERPRLEIAYEPTVAAPQGIRSTSWARLRGLYR